MNLLHAKVGNKMWYTIIIIGAITIYELRQFIKEKKFKDMAVFLLVAILSLTLGLIYSSDPMHTSLSHLLLDF